MLISFIALWTMAAILFFTDPKNSSNRWGAAFAFFSGFGCLGTVLENIFPNIEIQGITKELIWIVTCFIFTFSYQWTPYALLMYAIRYSGALKTNKFWYDISPYVLFLPVGITYIFTQILPEYLPNFLLLSVWGAPYAIVANFLLIYSYWTEKDEKMKNQRLFTCAVLTPATLAVMFSNYILRIFDIHYLWGYNFVPILIAFTIFIISSTRYGVMGIRVNAEKMYIENTIKAISSGTAILNHTLKNEAMKISICIENIEETIKIQKFCTKEFNEDIIAIKNSIAYLSSFIKRVNGHIGEIKLTKDKYYFLDIIKKALDMSKPIIKQKMIKVQEDIECEVIVNCDEIHICECINNIIKNAVEAMAVGGILSLKIVENKKDVILYIIDNGCGITQDNLTHVFEPFFSTKVRNMNFGLGLSYCYCVIKMHGGNLQIQSIRYKGTTVSLYLPKESIKYRYKK